MRPKSLPAGPRKSHLPIGSVEAVEADSWGLKPIEYHFAIEFDKGVRPMVQAFENVHPKNHGYTRAALQRRSAKIFHSEKFQLFLKNLGYRRLAVVEKERKERMVPGAEEITEDRIKAEESCLAFSNIKDLYAEDGSFIPIPDLPDRVARAISEFEGVMIDGEDGKKVVLIKKLKFWNKGDALSRLEKISGMSSGAEISVNVNLQTLLMQIDGQSRGRLPAEVG